MPPITQTFYPKTRSEWRNWLTANHKSQKEIWLLYPLKSSGLPSLAYCDAVQEAICFGWIDGQKKKYDSTFSCQRWTPRRPNSRWSELNKHQARLAIARELMTPAGQAVLPDLDPALFVIPPALLCDLQQNKPFWEKFCSLPAHYQRIRLDYIIRRMNRPILYQKTLAHFIRQTLAGKRYGPFKDNPQIY